MKYVYWGDALRPIVLGSKSKAWIADDVMLTESVGPAKISFLIKALDEERKLTKIEKADDENKSRHS